MLNTLFHECFVLILQTNRSKAHHDKIAGRIQTMQYSQYRASNVETLLKWSFLEIGLNKIMGNAAKNFNKYGPRYIWWGVGVLTQWILLRN